MIKVIAALVGVFFLPSAMASSPTTTDIDASKDISSLVFQVIQNQMVLDSSTVESATIVLPETPTDGYGVRIKLKTIAATKFGQMTENGIGKQGSFILNGIVISNPIIRSRIGDEFIVTGFTKKQANHFIESMSSKNN
ncbi:preprotein translocase subunit SecD [Legionella pneumophila serogroup 1]|uniref:SecDF P1 head subdomain-containing protein n=1 Tax=Legionella pneumophila TaxID=446 RepID=UPI0001E3C5AF|nr:preprotein translocase subunit SecD [Legionella pneumophila]MDW8869198.1 preprotein translocase subunit SecD [Legionella pneumophila]MDW8900326.1 preprotein translocase subunit SecD [Legionella pneumophila]MDW8908417.1 preprotein translocase subunit SecD [Legionella pneumophila]MDW8915208.1 preprotein translocase subunit SecD [Legionella pneumophila]MDW8923541.1 preprotein translocase subunit SecD [Legionella pneumophila]